VLCPTSVITGATSAGDFEIDRSFGATWAKVASSWVLALMYLWTLFAPIVWPDRFGAV